MNINEIQKIFSDRLRDLMLEHNIKNITALANKTKLPRTTISNWLNLIRTPQIDSLVVLAKFFDVSTDYLLGIED